MVQTKIAVMNKLIELTQGELMSENCQTASANVNITTVSKHGTKRDVVGSSKKYVRLEMLTKLHDHLLDLLVQCRLGKGISSDALLPTACNTAINLTESWRLDHDAFGIWIHGRKNGDTKRMIYQGRPWFRFRGLAGSMMLDRCVNWGSCGAGVGLYSKSLLPSEVGVITSITLNGANQQGDCQYVTDRASVIRCSDTGGEHDMTTLCIDMMVILQQMV